MKFLTRRAGIDSKEFNKLFLLILHSFFSAIFVSVFFSVSNAEFVNNFGSDFLPVGYLLSGIVGYLTVQGYGRLLRKSGFSAFVGGLLFLLGLTLVFRIILFFADENSVKWVSFVIFLFAMPFLSVSGLEQSGLLLKIYDLREGKKYAGIINSGGTVASILGYLSIPLLVPFLRSRYDLFFLAALGMGTAIFFLFRINKTFNLAEQKAPAAGSPVVPSDITLASLLRQPYIRYIAVCGGISMMAFYFVDYSFLINAKAQARSPQGLAAIIGGFFAFIKSAELVLSLLSGRIFRTFGLKTGMIILPAICAFISICAILIYNFADAGFFILIIFSLKFFERIVSKSIEEPTFKNLYQLLDPRDRLAIQAKIDGGTKQLFIIIGSIILLLYGHFMPVSQLKIGLLYISIPIFLFWLYCSSQLIRSFREKLRDILNPTHSNNDPRSKSAFQRLRLGFYNKTETRSNNILVNLLEDKLKTGKVAINRVAPATPAGKYDSYVPNHFFDYLVPAPAHSKLEFQLSDPLLVIPPVEDAKNGSSEKGFETFDERELSRMAFAGEQPDDHTIKQLGKKLGEVRNDHEKKLIINILETAEKPLSVSILLNHLQYPDYYIKKQVFKALESRNFKFGPKEEIYFRTSIENILEEISFLVSILSALPQNEAFTDLYKALLEEESILKNRLLSVLTWKYDKTSISVIRENIFSGPTGVGNTSNILALELIDNLVENELKPMIMPVFENGSYAWRLSALAKRFYYPSPTVEDALTNVVNYDYTKIGIWAKACALKILLKEKSGKYRKVISSLIYHPDLFLRSLALEYTEENNGNLVYPLVPKDELFLKINKGNKSNLKGSEIYECLKQLKNNSFFRKTSYNDLIRFSSSMEVKNPGGLPGLAAAGSTKNKPVFITRGNVVFEFKKNLPVKIFTEHLLAPYMFNPDEISAITMRSQAKFYELSETRLANLVLTSDSLLNDLLKK